MSNFYFTKEYGRPYNEGSKNSFTLEWGWTPSGPNVKNSWVLGIWLKLNYKRYGFALVRRIKWEKS